MNVEVVNAVLVKAILGFQEAEIEAMTEATIGGYKVPTPDEVASLRWKRGVIEVHTGEGMKKTKAHIFGVWALHRKRKSWTLTYVPTGDRLAQAIYSLEKAKVAIENSPSSILTIKRGDLGKKRDELARWAKKIGMSYKD